MRKAISNTGRLEVPGTRPLVGMMEVCTAFAHFTLDILGGGMIVLDIQGLGDKLIDPEIYSSNKLGDETIFWAGNMREDAIIAFKEEHNCNDLCRELGLVSQIQAKF